MHLNAEQPIEAAVLRVIVDHYAHDVTVQNVDQGIPPDDEMALVPVLFLDKGLEFLEIAQRTDDLGLLTAPDVRNLPAQGIEGAASLLVVLPRIPVPAVDVEIGRASCRERV